MSKSIRPYIVYGDAVYGPYDGHQHARQSAKRQGWIDYEICDTMDEAQLAVEAEWDR